MEAVNFLRIEPGTQLAFAQHPLCDVVLEFPRGKLIALIGRNGAGKTTLLRALLGEPVLSTGKLSLPGVAFVPQEHLYPPDLVVRGLLGLAFLPKLGWFRHLQPQDCAAIEEALVGFGLVPLADRSLKALSSGERQRVFLARAVLQQPKVLLLDEPTNHLDPAAVRGFWELLLEKRRGASFDVVASTHDLAFVQGHADWVCGLEKGRAVFSLAAGDVALPGKIADLFT